MLLLLNSSRTLTRTITILTSTPSSSSGNNKPSTWTTRMLARGTPSANRTLSSTSRPRTKLMTPSGGLRSSRSKRKRIRSHLSKPFSSIGTLKSKRRKMNKTITCHSIRMLKKETKEPSSCNNKTTSIRITWAARFRTCVLLLSATYCPPNFSSSLTQLGCPETKKDSSRNRVPPGLRDGKTGISCWRTGSWSITRATIPRIWRHLSGFLILTISCTVSTAIPINLCNSKSPLWASKIEFSNSRRKPQNKPRGGKKNWPGT